MVLFDDVLPALDWLSARYPIAAITNGNSDLDIIGLKHFFPGNDCSKRGGRGQTGAWNLSRGCKSLGRSAQSDASYRR